MILFLADGRRECDYFWSGRNVSRKESKFIQNTDKNSEVGPLGKGIIISKLASS